MHHVVIIGNGITGITAARTVRKLRSDVRITVVSGETDYFFSRTALMYVYMGHMTFEDTQPYEDWFWLNNRIELVRAYVDTLDTDARRLTFESGETLAYDSLLLAVGSKYNTFGWPGQDLPGVQGLVSKPDLDLMEENTRGVERAVVVGGGLIGVEMAEMLHSRGIHVTFLVREAGYMDYLLPPEEAALVGREILRHGIDLRLSTELDRILPGGDGRVGAVVTSQGEELPCGFVGLTAGVRPNLDLVEGTAVETNRGILVDAFFETNVQDVYAAGDCAEFREPPPGRRPVEQLWYTGRAHGHTVGLTLAGRRTRYTPGVFFNSAKFFDVEYQTYGDVPAELPDHLDSVFWEDPEARRTIRIVFRRTDRAVVGFNLFGVRYRQVVCADWIETETPVDAVLADLGAANCDPEFTRQPESALIARYNARHPNRPVELRRRRGLFAGLFS